MKKVWNNHPKKALTLLMVVGVSLFSIAWQVQRHKGKYHSEAEMVKMLDGNLPIFDNGVFVVS